MKNGKLLGKAIRTMMHAWGGDTPPECYWALQDMVTYINEETGSTLEYLREDCITEDDQDAREKAFDAIMEHLVSDGCNGVKKVKDEVVVKTDEECFREIFADKDFSSCGKCHCPVLFGNGSKKYDIRDGICEYCKKHGHGCWNCIAANASTCPYCCMYGNRGVSS
jgi:hypothetical protein